MRLTNLATIRYQALDECFSDYSKFYYIEDLVDAVNKALIKNGSTPVSKRTVQYTICQMEGNPNWDVCFIEPAKINGRRYYRYEDPNYSIWHRDLNNQQLSQLKSMLLMMRQFRGIPQFARLEKLIKDLEKHYQFELADTTNIIAFDTIDYVEGIKHLSPLFEAIVSKQSLCINYKPFNKSEFTAIVHPYYIKQYNNRWFLFGLAINAPYQGIINMALDRIQTIQLATDTYIPNESCDFEEFFSDIIGVSKPQEGEIVKIALRFTEHRLPYVLSKPMHESQSNHRIKERIIELNVIPNKELYQQILSFGCDVEVLEPQFVREEIAMRIEQIHKMYKK